MNTKSIKRIRRCFFVAVLALSASALEAQEIELPDGEVGVAYSASVRLDPEPEGTVYSATGLPDGLSINSASGEVSGTPTLADSFTPVFTFTFSGESNNVGGTIVIKAAAGTPEITSATTASGTVGQAFSYTFTASNSPTSYTLSGLPPGISQTTQGGAEISGTPTEAGSYSVSAFASNSVGDGTAVVVTVTIDPAGPVPVITSSMELSGDADALLTYQIQANNDPTSYAASGLPLGVNLNTETGLISGTPTIEATYEVSLTATNSFGTSETFILTITIGDVPVINNVLTLELTRGEQMIPFELSASNNPTSFSVEASALPIGLEFSDGLISGTPALAGIYPVTIFASNAVADGPEETLVITVVDPLDPNLSGGAVSVDLTNGLTLFFEFVRSTPVASNLDFFIETSTDLSVWASVPLDHESLTVTYTDNGDGTETVKVTFPAEITASASGFVRYRVDLTSL